MAIEDNASIALIPSGYKSVKLYSVIPESGNGDFTHSRGSTATRVAASGLIETVASGVPRLDYPLIDGVVQDCPALLLEPSRTNQAQRTEEFNNSYWLKSNSTITANQIISPNGSQTADKYTHAGSFAANYVRGIVGSVTSGNDYTFSVFVKKGTGNFVQLLFGSGAFGSLHQNFDIENGLIGSSSGDATAFIDEYPNGWYRVGITDNCTTTQSSATVFLSLAQSNTASRLNSFTSSDNFYVWGAQFEQGSYPTSYIPWDGSGTTTRSLDAAFGSGTTTEINSLEGTLFVDIAALSNNNPQHRRITLSNGSSGNVVRIAYDTGSQRITSVLFNGSNQCVFQATSSNSAITDVVDFNKVALSYKANEFKCFINGTQFSSTDTFGTTFAANTLNELAFDNGSGGNRFFGKVKQAMVFKTALTDSELQALTS